MRIVLVRVVCLCACVFDACLRACACMHRGPNDGLPTKGKKHKGIESHPRRRRRKGGGRRRRPGAKGTWRVATTQRDDLYLPVMPVCLEIDSTL